MPEEPLPEPEEAAIGAGLPHHNGLHLARRAPACLNNGMNAYTFDEPVIVSAEDCIYCEDEAGTLDVVFRDKTIACRWNHVYQYDQNYAAHAIDELAELTPY